MNCDSSGLCDTLTLGGITVEYEDIGPFTNIGSGLSGMSGRISHALGLRGGPRFAVKLHVVVSKNRDVYPTKWMV